MTGRRTKLVIAAMALTATGAEGAAAQQPATFGGGRLPSAAAPQSYVPTVGISLQPRGARIAMRFDSSVALRARRLRHRRPRGGPVRRHDVQPAGRVDPERRARAARVRVDGQRADQRRQRHRHPARRRRAPDLRARAALHGEAGPGVRGTRRGRAGGRTRAAAAARLLRRHEHRTRSSTGIPAPVMLRATKDARKVTARWTMAAKCRRGPRESFVNLTPATKVGPNGGFARKERFSVRYADALVRYRTSFAGRIADRRRDRHAAPARPRLQPPRHEAAHALRLGRAHLERSARSRRRRRARRRRDGARRRPRPPSTQPVSDAVVSMTSDPGDYIGQGTDLSTASAGPRSSAEARRGETAHARGPQRRRVARQLRRAARAGADRRHDLHRRAPLPS